MRCTELMGDLSRAVLVAVAVAALAACGSGQSGSAPRLSIGEDPGDLVESVRWIEEGLPEEAEGILPPRDAQGVFQVLGVAQILPGSEPGRLLVNVWADNCQPLVTVSVPEEQPTSGVRLEVGIAHSGETCGEALRNWSFEVRLNRDVDPADVTLLVEDSR